MHHSSRSTISRALAALTLSVPAVAQTVEAKPVHERAHRRALSTHTADVGTSLPSGSAARAESFAPPERTEVLYSTGDDGTTWASGASYKASFGADGATYIPFFGSAAPRNFPVKLALGRALVGGSTVELHPAASVARRDDTFTIDRGPIDELYELALDHVEQRFVVKERPGVGALDLFVPLTSELELVSNDGAIELHGEHGTVSYGRAFARLDDGSRVPLETAVEDGAVRIHVDAAFMASARFPLVIDPIISTFSITAFGVAPTMAYDVSTDRYLIAWTYEFSATDHDVLWHVRTAGGTPIANGIADNTTDNCGHPSAANLEGQDQFLLVYQRQATGTTAWKVWGRSIQAANAAQSIRFLISTEDSFGDKVLPVVGGDPYFGEAYYCVVWTRNLTGELDIHGRLVRYDNTLVGTGTMSIDNTIGALDSIPSISKSNGNIANAAWTIAWQRAGAPSSIWAARLSYAGVMLNPPTMIASSANFELTSPAVSSPRADGRVCLVYGYDDYFRYELLNGVTIVTGGYIAELFPNANPFFQYDAAYSVDADQTHFVATLAHSDNNGQTYQPYAVTLASISPTTMSVTEGPVLLGSQMDSGGDVVGHWGSGGATQQFGLVWGSGGVKGATFWRWDGGVYTTTCTGNGPGNGCPCSNTGSIGHGCANSQHAGGALLTAIGYVHTGPQDNVHFTLSDTPTGSPAVLFQGTSTLFPPITFGDGTLCTAGTITRFALIFQDMFGTHTWPQGGGQDLSVQGGVPIYGAERWYQAYYRDAASFCTASAFNTSNGVRLYWLP